MGVAFSEGLASTIGQYLLNGCEGSVAWARPNGLPADIAENIWNGDSACDADDGCRYHHVRWHLKQRGLREDSADWALRVSRLRALTAAASLAGHRMVGTNQELRVAQWGCDLLDRDSDVSYADGRIRNMSYVRNFTFQVAEILDGVSVVPSIALYASDPAPENVRIRIDELFDAMANFCSNCGSLPGGSRWGAAYNSRRVSIDGYLSPQALSRYLEAHGLATSEELRNLLKANFMEDTY